MAGGATKSTCPESEEAYQNVLEFMNELRAE